jgi:hypothetical protein
VADRPATYYAGPHLPPYGARAAAEFLGSTLSLRKVDRYDETSCANNWRRSRCYRT